MTTRAQRARDGAAERWNDAAGPPDGPPRSLEETLEAWQRDAVVLRRHGHGNDADLITRIVADVRDAAAPYLEWVSDTGAYTYSGRTPQWLRARFAVWAAERNAEERHGLRYYRRIVLPVRVAGGD